MTFELFGIQRILAQIVARTLAVPFEEKEVDYKKALEEVGTCLRILRRVHTEVDNLIYFASALSQTLEDTAKLLETSNTEGGPNDSSTLFTP